MSISNWGAPEPDSNWDDPDEEVVESQFDDWDESSWEMSEGR